MGTSTITIRLDDELKREASEVTAQYGPVTRAFYQQMVSTHSIPLTLVPEEPNAESLEAIAEGSDFLASGRPGRFTNGHDLIGAAMN